MTNKPNFITFKVDLTSTTITVSTINEQNKEQFNLLTNQEKKEFLISIIEKNTLYINYSEIDDEINNISDEVKSFNHSFYKNN